MSYVCPVNQLEQRLKEAGEHLALPPSSTKDLLELLDKTEHLLTFVGQAPSISMQGALVPSMGALIVDGLVKHSEIDVRVSVASCLCEVARITAPKPPYKDEIMKDIFQLNVLAFGLLSNWTGQSYHKAIHILESVAKVRSCLLMLDLECDALVLEMFEHFLREIRVDHPHTVFTDMEAIMTSVIKESDKIATDLLSLLISHVKKENQIVTPASWKVAEKVLRNCNNTLKPYSKTIMELVNSNPDDYAEVVTALCRNTLGNGHMVTRSTGINSTHKRDLNTLENGGSMKKQKYIDKNQLNAKELEPSRRGRPKKNKNSSKQDNCSNPVQNSQDATRRTRFQDKKKSSKTKGSIKNSGFLYNVVIKKEDETLSDHDGAEPLMQQTNYQKIQNRRKPSSNKRLANGSRGKDSSKKWGQDLVGHRIEVWWPLDKMYYKGAVSSYNPLDQKHKVLYADGDEEVLDLHREKWTMLDESSPNQEQVADLPSPTTTHAKRKQKGKRKVVSSIKQEDNPSSPKRPPLVVSLSSPKVVSCLDNRPPLVVSRCSPKMISCLNNSPQRPHAESSRNTDIICNNDNQNNNPVLTPADSSKTTAVTCNVNNQKNNPVSTPGISCGSKLTRKETNDMEKNGDTNSNGDLQEKILSESSRISTKIGMEICRKRNRVNQAR